MKWRAGHFGDWESANKIYGIEVVENEGSGKDGKFRTYWAETKGETWHREEFGMLHDCLCLAKATCEEHAKTHKPKRAVA